MANLCRCGHLIQHHEIATGYNGEGLYQRVETCKAHQTGLFDKCDCSKVRPIDNLGYLEELYAASIKSR